MYASHIITGAGFVIVCFNDKRLYDKAKLLRGWGRSSAVFNESEGMKKDLILKLMVYLRWKIYFSWWGYNFTIEISAAFALEQLKKLSKNMY